MINTPENWQRFYQRIDAFQYYNAGWLALGNKLATSNIVAEARDFIARIGNDIEVPESALGKEGEIILGWDDCVNSEIWIRFLGNGQISFFVSQDSQLRDHAGPVALEQIFKRLREKIREISKTSS